MSWTDRITILIAALMLSATLGVGMCSTVDATNRQIDGVNLRINDVQADVNRRFDDVQADIRELRTLVLDALKRVEPAD